MGQTGTLDVLLCYCCGISDPHGGFGGAHFVIIGMDFGTTNSGLALYDGQIRLLPMDPSNPMAPQVLRTTLYISREHQYYIGREAIDEYYRRNQGRPVRLRREYVGEIQLTFADLGTFYRDVYVWVDELEPGRLFRSIKTYLPDTAYTGTSVWGRFYRLEDTIGTFLLLAKTRAERTLHREIDEVVLGRPVKFGMNEEADRVAEERLARAAILAGYKRVYFELEPVAAALRYQQDVRTFQRILVFDFGGGTLDITVMEVDGLGSRRILSTDGVRIAGDVFDGKIISARLARHFGADITYGSKGLKMPHQILLDLADWQTLGLLNQPEILSFLTEVERTTARPKPVKALRSLIGNSYGLAMFDQVEQAKALLSNQLQTVIRFSGQDIAIEERLSRSEFERIIREEAAQIERCVDRALATANLEPDQIDVVVRTGGSSLIPLFQRLLAVRFGEHKLRAMDAFSSVTAGLGVAAHLVSTGELGLRSYGPEILGREPASPVLTLSQELAEQDAYRGYVNSDEHARLQASSVADPIVVVSISRNGYAKRTPSRLYAQRPRGVAPVPDMVLDAGDGLGHLIVTSNKHTLLLLTDRGRLFSMPVSDVPLMARERRGRHLRNYVPLFPDERVSALTALEAPTDGEPLIVATDQGMVYCIFYPAAAAAGAGGRVLDLPSPHLPVAMLRARNGGDVFIATNHGMAVRLPAQPIGSGGVIGIRPRPHERVVGVLLVDDDSVPVLVSSDGFVSRRSMSVLPAGKNRRKMLLLKGDAQLACMVMAERGNDLLLASEKGQVARTGLQGMSASGRAVRGKQLMDVAIAGEVQTAAVIPVP